MPDATDAWSDIRLSDVVVSEPKGFHSKLSKAPYMVDDSRSDSVQGGVLQYDKKADGRRT